MRKFGSPALWLSIAIGLLALSPGVADEVGDPFPCETVCVPIPTFPFILCAPSCGDPGAPGPGLADNGACEVASFEPLSID
ncbi:hypothetical protein ABI59_07495 [Acidobacteria bacterium Mor1]|nr:hypothetical protein ABI59_07495 [Acidobacteria bacterium Mor1]